MGNELTLLLVLAAAYALAAVARPLLGWSGAAGWLLTGVVVTALMAMLLIVPASQVRGRALVAFCCTDLALKLIDYTRERRKAVAIAVSYWDYLCFLCPVPILLVRLKERRHLTTGSAWWEVRRALLSAPIVIAMFLLLKPLSAVELIRATFPLDHAIKLVMFVVLLEAGSSLAHSLERLAGYDTTAPMRQFFLALTPAEFWLRYNTRVHSWLEANVYRPCGGRVRGVLVVFFVSAVLHEVMFDLTTSTVRGYQFAFFMLQAPAVIASPWLKQTADRYGLAGRAAVYTLTIAWFYITSPLFFWGVDRIFENTYASEPWLP